MSEAKPTPTGPERRWRKDQPPQFRDIEKGGRIVLLTLGVVILAAVIVGTIWWIKPAPQTYLYCYPFGAYTDPHWSPAPWFFHDADRMCQTLSGTSQNFHSRLEKKRLTDLEQTKHDTLIIYVAGRGAIHDNRAYLLPSDAKAGDPKTWISLDELIHAIEKSPSKNKLLLLDIACSGTSLYTGPLLDQVSDAADAYFSRSPPPFPVLTACSKGEISNVMAVTGTSVFGYYLQQALEGRANGFGGDSNDQYITVDELVSFVSTRVNRWSSQNIGRTQKPQLYGKSNFSVAHLRKITSLPTPTQPIATLTIDEESKLSPDEKTKRKETQEKLDQDRLALIFPQELEKGWSECNPWLLPALHLNRSPESLIDQREYSLRLAALNRYMQKLYRYEDTSMLFKNSMQSGQNEEVKKVAFTLKSDLSFAEVETEKVLKSIEKDAQREPRTSSITGLWPRDWFTKKPKIPPELERAFNACFSSLPATTATPTKAETSFDPKAFLAVVSGKKDNKDKEPPVLLGRESLFLCWDTLCNDTLLSLEKLNRIEALMKGAIDEVKPEKLGTRCNELVLLRWLIEQSSKDWNYSDNKSVEPIYHEMVHDWLLAEYYAERCAHGFLPDGIGFSSHKEVLDKLWNEHRDIVKKIITQKMMNKMLASEIKEYSRLFQNLIPRYELCLKTIKQERSQFDAWWDAMVTLQATAEMMVSEEPVLWLRWKKLAEATLELGTYMETRTINAPAREIIQAVIQARIDLLEPYANLATTLAESGKKKDAYLRDCQSIERALKSGLLNVVDRKMLHGMLINVQEKNHEQTLDTEKGDTTGKTLETSQTHGDINPTSQADRRREISKYLLQLGGLTDMQKRSFPNDWQASASILQKAWTQELPELLKKKREQKNWLAAARAEAVLPNSSTTDALLQWRLIESVPYLDWLAARQRQVDERWK